MKRKTQPFDLAKAIPQAWSLLWAANLKERTENPGAYRAGSTYYITASDLENQVRRFAIEQAAGEPWGSRGRAWGRDWERVRISVRGGLNSRCRDWLLEQVRRGVFSSHNFGRGHISGMRFRPAGEPISEAETRTIAVNTKRRAEGYKAKPCHYQAGGKLACQTRRSFRQSRAPLPLAIRPK